MLCEMRVSLLYGRLDQDEAHLIPAKARQVKTINQSIL